MDSLDDDALAAAIPHTTVFARVSPEQKSRIIKIARRTGVDVAYMGDGVNDAVALHAADVGISVESATDIAKDAADIVLLDKDLGVLADGVMEGRRIFANTIKYVLMATSSNFGNMFIVLHDENSARVDRSANVARVSIMLLIVFASSAISPFASTVSLRRRSPFATAVTTFAMPRTWLVRLAAMKLTFSVRPRHVPETP